MTARSSFTQGSDQLVVFYNGGHPHFCPDCASVDVAKARGRRQEQKIETLAKDLMQKPPVQEIQEKRVQVCVTVALPVQTEAKVNSELERKVQEALQADWRENEGYMLSAIRRENRPIFSYASAELKANREFVRKAAQAAYETQGLEGSLCVFELMDPSLKADSGFIREVFKNNQPWGFVALNVLNEESFIALMEDFGGKEAFSQELKRLYKIDPNEESLLDSEGIDFTDVYSSCDKSFLSSFSPSLQLSITPIPRKESTSEFISSEVF